MQAVFHQLFPYHCIFRKIIYFISLLSSAYEKAEANFFDLTI